MRVLTDLTESIVENDQGRDVPSVCLSCRRCGFMAQSYGIGDSSIRRCLTLLNRGCPNGEDNYYAVADAEVPA